jgi:rubrerythrin
MPDFSDPFVGNAPQRKLTRQELIRAIRLDIAAEHEAICLYMAHAEATDDKLVRKALIDIANEEREHLGEFERLLQLLTEDEADFRQDGSEEIREMEEEVNKEGNAGS